MYSCTHFHAHDAQMSSAQADQHSIRHRRGLERRMIMKASEGHPTHAKLQTCP